MDIAKVLGKYWPDTKWTLSGDEYDGLVWLSDTVKPTLQEIVVAWEQYKLERDVAPAPHDLTAVDSVTGEARVLKLIDGRLIIE
jgi:hypothetical protein